MEEELQAFDRVWGVDSLLSSNPYPRRPLPGTPNYPVATPSLDPSLTKPQVVVGNPEYGPEWSIQEDWALYQAVTNMQKLPLASASPAHTPNWDLAADMVNSVSGCYRAGKQCRARYEGSFGPREEGQLLYDVTTKKIKKLGMTNPETKVLTPTPKQGMKAGALFKADDNTTFSTMYSGRFEIIKSLASKRAPITKPLLVNPTTSNPKLAAVLPESEISYNAPLNPGMVAANRAERIAKEKLRTAQTAQLAAQPAVATTGLASPPVAVSQTQARATAQTISSMWGSNW